MPFIIQRLHFNSIKVRLKQEYEKRKRENRIFQFHKGTIKTSISPPLSLRPPNFNSIKVRLKLYQHKSQVVRLTFQFHKGTIKTTIPNWFQTD